MTPATALSNAYDLLEHIAGHSRMRSAQASVLLLAIQLQEAPNQEQKQIGGPAVGTYQFERGGGIAGVLRHEASQALAVAVCKALGVAATVEGVAIALQNANDTLDAALARLLLWTDRAALPAVGDVEGAFQTYLRVWRPGAYTRGLFSARKALRDKWSRNYAKALDQVTT